MADKPICKIEGCGKRVVAWKMCDLHYRAWRREGNPPVRVRQSASCQVDGCDKPSKTGSMCTSHYKRLLRHGDPLAGRTRLGEPEHYLETVVMAYDGDECLPWPFATSAGYGVTTIDRKRVYVSRYVCTRIHGEPPTPEHEAAHSCGNGRRACVTKGHLSWKTGTENQADRIAHGTSNRGEKHGMAKLTDQQVREIRSLLGTRSHSSIAKMYGVSRPHISGIASGRDRTHV